MDRMMATSIPAVLDLNFGTVDVRDVATAHIRAMTIPEAAGMTVHTHARTHISEWFFVHYGGWISRDYSDFPATLRRTRLDMTIYVTNVLQWYICPATMFHGLLNFSISLISSIWVFKPNSQTHTSLVLGNHLPTESQRSHAVLVPIL